MAPRRLTPAESELDAGPPISLAPAAVIAARARQGAFGTHEGKGKIADLLTRAGKSAHAGNLVGPAKDSALALVLQAVQQAPDDPHVKTGTGQRPGATGQAGRQGRRHRARGLPQGACARS
jgi:hypothetical protein